MDLLDLLCHSLIDPQRSNQISKVVYRFTLSVHVRILPDHQGPHISDRAAAEESEGGRRLWGKTSGFQRNVLYSVKCVIRAHYLHVWMRQAELVLPLTTGQNWTCA